MKELEYRRWLNKSGVSKKMESDFVSRLKRIETKLGIYDIDEEYKFDKCIRLMQYLSDGCKNSPYPKSLEFTGTSNQHTVLKYALKKYISFLESIKF